MRWRWIPLFLMVLMTLFWASAASASDPFLVVPPDAVAMSTRAWKYANMTGPEALAELKRRKVKFKAAERVPGVITPIRLDGPLNGVLIHSALPKTHWATTKFEILDARLALAIHDFTYVLRHHDIVELIHYTMWRPNGAKPGAKTRKRTKHGKTTGKRKKRTAKTGKTQQAQSRSKAKQPVTHPKKPSTRSKKTPKKRPRTKGRRKGASLRKSLFGKGTLLQTASLEPIGRDRSRSKRGATKKRPAAPKAKPSRKRRPKSRATKGRRGKGEKFVPIKKKMYSPPGTRHPAGLAIDLGAVRKKDGRWLSVGNHFEGRIGQATCGPKAQVPKTARGRELQSLVCEAEMHGIFTYVLTPNYDRPHADHFHMEIRPRTKWYLYH